MKTLLEVSNLGRAFGGLLAVNDLSFSVREGEIMGLIGPNGAGKTTVVNLVSGVIRPTSGTVRFDGHDVTGVAPHVLARLGLVRTFQATAVYASRTVRENAMRGAYLHRFPGLLAAFLSTQRARRLQAESAAEVDRLLTWLGLDKVASAQADALPYGYQKTLGIVIALAAEPRMILLDEPVAGLSVEETNHVRDTIRRVRDRGITVVVIDHNMRFISDLCDRVVVASQGEKLAEGTPKEALSSPRVIEAYLGKAYVSAQSR